MLRFGKISEVQADKGLFRVKFDEDDLTSGWIFGAVKNSKENKDECPFDLDEHVACVMDENCEHGVIICSIYDAANLPVNGNPDIRSTTYQDGSFVKFDRAAKKLTVSCEGDVEIIKCTNFKVTASDKIKFNDGLLGGLAKIGSLVTKLNALENKVNALVIFSAAHVHAGVTAGGAVSGIPVTPVVGAIVVTTQVMIENDKVIQ